MNSRKTVEFIAIGDELLNGLRSNTHLTYFGEKLLPLGLPILRACEIRDEPAEMHAALSGALQRADLILVSGGLGPTSDDLTVEVVADVLGIDMVHDVSVESAIREFFARRGRTPSDNNFRQCRIIAGAQVLHNANGTAPGQWIEHKDKIIVLLPGPPNELKPMFEEQVIPLLFDREWVDEDVSQVILRSVGMGESMVASVLSPVLQPHKDHIRIAYCAHLSYVDVRLTSNHPDVDECGLYSIADACRSALGRHFLCFGAGDIAAILLEQLRELNQTLAVAESCTGGLLASRFTDVPGASKTFKGGVVCYRNEIKEQLLGVPDCLIEQHGAVSAECSVAMATGVAELMESDYALAISGFAGPEGGNEPAGTIYIGFCSPVGVWSHKVILPGNRIAVKERAVTYALDFMRCRIQKARMQNLLDNLRC